MEYLVGFLFGYLGEFLECILNGFLFGFRSDKLVGFLSGFLWLLSCEACPWEESTEKSTGNPRRNPSEKSSGKIHREIHCEIHREIHLGFCRVVVRGPLGQCPTSVIVRPGDEESREARTLSDLEASTGGQDPLWEAWGAPVATPICENTTVRHF